MTRPNKILLVDDEVAVRNTYQLYFEAHGYSVLAAASIPEALHQLRNENIVLAIIDIFLYGENGLDLLRGIVAARPDLPVIIMSAISPDQPQFEEARQAGAVDVYSKIRPLSQLLASVHRIMGSLPSAPPG